METQDVLILKATISALDPSEVIDIEETISDVKAKLERDWTDDAYTVDVELISYDDGSGF